MTSVSCSCGHEWETRKPLEDIETLRCSECGNASQDDINIEAESADETASDGSNLLTEVKARAKREDLLESVRDLIERVEGTGSDDTYREAAREVRSEYNALIELRGVLDDFETSISLEEIRDMEAFVEDIESEIDEHADPLERVNELHSTKSDLQAQISELRSTREDLKADVDNLEERCNELSRARQSLKETVDDLREDASDYKQGYEDGMAHFEITIPCAECGRSMRIEPGSPMHREAIDLLQQNGWGHSTCISTSTTRSAQHSW